MDEKTNEDLTQSFSDKSRGLLQTSHSTEQSVFSSECVRVDTSNQLDTDEDCKQSDTPCDDQMHVESGKHTCEVCKKKFTQLQLGRHMSVHSVWHFSCKICDEKFIRSLDLKRHMVIHMGELPFSCKVCNKKFTGSSQLKQHMHVHMGERPLSCKVCYKKFTQPSVLNTHVLTCSFTKVFANFVRRRLH